VAERKAVAKSPAAKSKLKEPTADAEAMKKPRGGAEIKAALLAAADYLFGKTGPDAVSNRDIAAQAGLIQPLIFRYFGSKDELIRQVLRRHVGIFRNASSEHTPRAVAGAMFNVMAENPAFMRVLAFLQLNGHPPEAYLTKEGGIANLAHALDEDMGDDARLEAAILSSQMMGWLLFEPFLLYSSDYRGDPKVARQKVYERILASVPDRSSPS